MFKVTQDHGWESWVRSTVLHFSPAPISHLMSTVEHSHQGLLIIDAREDDDYRCVGGYQIQVVFSEIKVESLNSKRQHGSVHSLLYFYGVFSSIYQQNLLEPTSLPEAKRNRI